MSLIPLVSAHTITVPTSTYFGIPSYGTYINFADDQSFDTVYRAGNYWYLDDYRLSVENANMSVSTFFEDNELIFSVSGSSGINSTTNIYVGDYGEPKEVEGADDWDWNSSNSTLTVYVTHASSRTVTISWKGGGSGFSIFGERSIFILIWDGLIARIFDPLWIMWTRFVITWEGIIATILVLLTGYLTYNLLKKLLGSKKIRKIRVVYS